jgi:hypothetical protein
VSENTNPNQRKTLALTPGTDFAFNFRNDQNVWTRHGNDTILAFDPASPVPIPPPLTELEGTADQFTWQVLLGDFLDEEISPDLFARPQITGRRGNDRFILGDWKQPYYLDNFILGLQRQAIVADFQPELDTIQLHGSRENYTLIPFALAGENPQTGEVDTILGRALVWLGPDQVTQRPDFDIVAFFPDVPPGPGLPAEGLPLPDFNLDGDYFEFVGTTPPPGPAEPFVLQKGTIGVDSAFGVATDKFGNVYTIGGTTGTLGESSQGSWDVWIAKYDNQGREQWVKQLGTAHTEVGWDIETFVTPEGEVNFYAVGTTTGNLALELGGTQPNEGYQDIWLARFDSEGNLIWIQQNPQPIPGPEIDNSLQLDVDAQGNVYLSGVTVENVNLPEVAFQDFSWVGSFDIDGNLRWFNGDTLDSPEFPPGFEETYGISVAPDGSTFATGFAQGSLGGPAIGVYDVWLARFNEQGENLWVTKFGSINYEFAWGVATDKNSNAYVAGVTAGDLAGPNAGFNDAFLAKYDKDGNQQWIKQFGTSGDDGLFLGDIVIDAADNVYVTGFTNSDLGGSNQGSYDTWVASFNTHGEQNWITQFGSSELDMPSAMTVDDNGAVFVTGFTTGSLGESNQGATDAWIAKLDANTGKLNSFNGSVPAPVDDPILFTPGQAGQTVNVTFTWTDRDALYNNEMGVFVVDDAEGRIGNLRPGDVGYAEAVLTHASRQIIFASGQTAGAVAQVTLPSQKYVGLYLIQNATSEDFLAANAKNEIGKGPLAFFNFTSANPDGFDHVITTHDKIAWEDLTNGGDQDFNDIVFRYEYGNPNSNATQYGNWEVATAELNDSLLYGGEASSAQTVTQTDDVLYNQNVDLGETKTENINQVNFDEIWATAGDAMFTLGNNKVYDLLKELQLVTASATDPAHSAFANSTNEFKV